jgi:hypothetical protein
LPFSRLSETAIRDWLAGQKVSDQLLDRAVAYSRGCPGRAKRFLDQTEELEREWQQVQATLQMLRCAPLGRCCGELERVSHELESAEDTESAWRQWLGLGMQGLAQMFREEPKKAAELGQGLLHAWKLAGTTLSPRLALEWALARPYLTNRKISSFLYPSYL